MIKLDFSLERNEERLKLVQEYIAENPSYKFTKKELETIGTYLLCGKDAEGTNPVLKKEVELDTKYKSYQKKKPESLEALLESPTFSENEINAAPIRYKSNKGKIDREKDKEIPGLSSLFETIDHYEEIIAEIEKEDPNSPKLYHLKHFLIELRKEQYRIKGEYYQEGTQVISREASTPIDPSITWDEEGGDYTISPLGLYSELSEKRFTDFFNIEEKDYVVRPGKFSLNYCDPAHIYALLESYNALLTENYGKPDALPNLILKTLDFYINFADLSPIKKDIIEFKKIEAKNFVIQQYLYENYGVTYSLNYISTIYKKQICGEIAEAAQLHYDGYMERENPNMWKICGHCKRKLLRDSRNFMIKSRSADGYSTKCKKCLKEERDERKANK